MAVDCLSLLISIAVWSKSGYPQSSTPWSSIILRMSSAFCLDCGTSLSSPQLRCAVLNLLNRYSPLPSRPHQSLHSHSTALHHHRPPVFSISISNLSPPPAHTDRTHLTIPLNSPSLRVVPIIRAIYLKPLTSSHNFIIAFNHPSQFPFPSCRPHNPCVSPND